MSNAIRNGVLTVAFVVVSARAEPSLAGPFAGVSHSCPYGNEYADGCSLAPANGNFINPDFFSYGKQSGQGNYYSAPSTASNHPPPWNLAGVDYPVGYSTSRKLKDPATAKLPAGCTFSATGSLNGGAIVVCSGVTNVAFKSWDFSLHNCTALDIKNNVVGTIAIEDSKFVNDSNCSNSNGYLVFVENKTAADFVFKHNFVDGNALNFPTSLNAMIWANVSGKVLIEYNAFLHSPARPIATGTTQALLAAFNYWEGFGYHAGDGHGEVIIDPFGVQTQPSQTYSFNTVLEPNNVCSSCGTASFYASSGEQGSTIETVQVDHNTSIINLSAADGGVTVAAAASETAWHTYGTVRLDSNYMDPTGAYFCFGSVSNPVYNNPPVFTGNVNMTNGKTVDQFNE